MTVKELIAKLQILPLDANIEIYDYDSGQPHPIDDESLIEATDSSGVAFIIYP